MNFDDTVIYPFDQQFLSVLRHLKIEKNRTSLVSPPGWGLEGMDAGEIDFGDKLGVCIQSDFDNALSNCRSAFFSGHDTALDEDKFLLPKICKAITEGKKTICAVKLAREQFEFLSMLAKIVGGKFEYINDCFKYVGLSSQTLKSKDIAYKKILTPVITVMGIMQGVGKLDIQLSLRSHLSSLGYKPLLVASRSYASVFDAHPIPSFMTTVTDLSYSEKILLFNNYIKQLEVEHQPDVIIIGLPGGIMPLAEDQTSEYGVLHYMITRAVEPDSSMMCLYQDDFIAPYFDSLRTLCEYRFSSRPAGFYISNLKVNWSMHESDMSIQTSYLKKTHSALHWSDIHKNVFTKTNVTVLFDEILEELCKNSELEAI